MSKLKTALTSLGAGLGTLYGLGKGTEFAIDDSINQTKKALKSFLQGKDIDKPVIDPDLRAKGIIGGVTTLGALAGGGLAAKGHDISKKAIEKLKK